MYIYSTVYGDIITYKAMAVAGLLALIQLQQIVGITASLSQSQTTTCFRGWFDQGNCPLHSLKTLNITSR